MKPLIGVVGRIEKNHRDVETVQCHEGVRRNIINNGGVPIMILPPQNFYYMDKPPRTLPRLTDEEKEDLKRVIDLCDGIIMPGATVLYEFDQFIYEYAFSKDMPIFGICGGMQQMVFSDINNPEERVLDKIESSIPHQSRELDYVHKVSIVEGTLLYDIVKSSDISVNSRHIYKIKRVNNLIVSGYSEDGIIEAVEFKNKKFVLGVQWHPEDMCEYDEPSNKLFKYFVDKCKK